MLATLDRAAERAARFFTDRGLTRARLARVCAALFALSLIPLIVIAVYNYPADDDFAYALPAATAWTQTHSLGAVAQAIFKKTMETYQSWQGDFVSTALFGISPMVFDIRLYFLSNWAMLALLCLSLGYLVKGVARDALGADRATFWIVYPVAATLMLQFMPAIGYSIYWHNGGQYTTAACTLMLLLGLLARASVPQGRARSGVRGALALLCGFLLGGSFYGPALGAATLLALLTLAAWARGARFRWHSLAALLGFAVAFAISASAPGVAVRQGLNGEPTGALYAVVTAALDSFDLAGGWLTPQLFAGLILLCPALWKPLRDSRYAFRHPFFVAVMLYGLFAATLVPGIYTKAGYDTPRYLNAIYFYFLLAALGSAAYAEGALIRLWERRAGAGDQTAAHALAAGANRGERFTLLYLTLCVGMLALGGFAYTIMNTATLSAAKSLATGEAARFSQEMQERQAYILATDSDSVAVQPLSAQPGVFKNDRLPFQGIYGRVRYMKWYFALFATEPAGTGTP